MSGDDKIQVLDPDRNEWSTILNPGVKISEDDSELRNPPVEQYSSDYSTKYLEE